MADNSLRKERATSPLIFSRLYTADFQKPGTITAEVKQMVETKSFYPTKKTENEMNGGLFTAEEFGFSEQEFLNNETRVAWINVPEGTPEALVIKRIEAATNNGGCIYRVLSNTPILTDDQKFAVTSGLRRKDEFANSQAMRYPEGHEQGGQLILDSKGNAQYRRTFFWPTPMADIDDRGKEVYLSPELEAELKGAHVLEGQPV